MTPPDPALADDPIRYPHPGAAASAQAGSTEAPDPATNPDAATITDLEGIRRRLSAEDGPTLWRSLEEAADDDSFRELVHNEFPRQAAVWPEGVDRRRFMQLAGASLAFGGLTACTRQPFEEIVPYVQQPEQVIPGRPLYFATSTHLGGYATGVLAESHMGRPTKLEGNPEHPAGTGATDLFTQAQVLTLYDPDRSKVAKNNGRIRSWDSFVPEFKGAVRARQALGAERMRILTGTVTSPLVADRIRKVLAALPEARWHQYEPVTRDGARRGAHDAFGQAVEVHYDLAAADVIVALDADFLTTGPGSLQYARDFTARRKVHGESEELNRLYAFESTPTSTGTMADHRIPVRASQIGSVALSLAAELGVAGVKAPAGLDDQRLGQVVAAAAADLAAHGSRALVIAGDYADPTVHTLAHAINEALGNQGSTVRYTEPVEAEPIDQTASLRELVEAMNAGEVDSLLVIEANPVYDAPADLGFAQAMYKVGRRVHLGLYEDETGEMCQWHIPAAHFLECWGDGRSYEGTATLCQPLIEPLYGGRSAAELLAMLVEDEEIGPLDLLRSFWEARLNGAAEVEGTEGAEAPAIADFDAFWQQSVHDGFIAGTAAPAVPVTLATAAVTAAGVSLAAAAGSDLELVLRPDPTVWDGRFANNGWLQECPKPLSLLTWDNPALIGPALAQRLGIENGRMVRLEHGGRSLEVPVWILPGHADGVVTLYLGSGRRRAGGIGNGAGFNAYALRGSDTPWLGTDLTVTPIAGNHPLASTQLHQNIALEGKEAASRELIRVATAEEFEKHPEFAHHHAHPDPAEAALFPLVEYTGYAWGLSLDLNACTGCNACVIACQSENNIPVVGKEQVLMGREMHWIRIDRYYKGDLDKPEVHHQPMMCQHCEHAPCELVCPVGATVHSDEGLNDMVYNRCVGTRYCSNNCPYKVRRFNFFKYNDYDTPVLDLLRNPDVTVRSRGVMEKCTFCVQRINTARITAKTENRKVRDGEIVTACQQVCPTEAIVFGDINDESSRVSKSKAEPRNYTILDDLNTRPRTSYLAKVTNPNPALASKTSVERS